MSNLLKTWALESGMVPEVRDERARPTEGRGDARHAVAASACAGVPQSGRPARPRNAREAEMPPYVTRTRTWKKTATVYVERTCAHARTEAVWRKGVE